MKRNIFIINMVLFMNCAGNGGESLALESLLSGIFPDDRAVGANNLEIAHFPMRHMTERGYPASLSIFDGRLLPRVLQNNPLLPTDPDDLIGLAACMYSGERNGRPCGDVFVLRDGGEIPLTGPSELAVKMLFLGLRNPEIDDGVRESVDRGIATQLGRKAPRIPTARAASRFAGAAGTSAKYNMAFVVPTLGPCTELYYSTEQGLRICVTDRFWISWYYKENPDAPPEAVLTDEQIFSTIEYLNTAWDKYADVFGQEHVPETFWINPGYKKLAIDFTFYSFNWEFEQLGVTSSSWNFIGLNAVKWKQLSGIQKPTSAHELFHRVQYRYGYQVNAGYESADWFVEGTAGWAESMVWNQTSVNNKYSKFYESPILDLLFGYENTPAPFLEAYAPAAANFWYYFDEHLDEMTTLLDHYEDEGKIVESIDKILLDRFGPNGVYNNLIDYLALWRRDKINGTHAPTGVLNEYEQPVGPLQVELRCTKHFTPLTASQWSGLLTMYANGSRYGMLYVDPLLKSGAKTLHLTFTPTSPDVPMQYQLVFAKCSNALIACGLPDEGWGVSNVPRNEYHVVRTIYPFFAEHNWEYNLLLDSTELDWDMVYIVLGNRASNTWQEHVTVGAELQDSL